MAKKTWAGTSQTDTSTTAGDYAAADNWEPISLRNATYRWLASGSGTNEYYLDLSGGGDPGIPEPSNVQEFIAGERTNMTAGTAGSLAAGAWDYADNDTLGYSTIYVRLTSGAADPDSRVLDYVTYTAIPVAGDDVRIPAGAGAISSNLGQSGVAIGDFIVEAGFSNLIGAEGNILYIDPDRFEFAGTGESWIDIGSANITARVTATKSPTTGKHGLYLTGSNIAVLDVAGGNVGLAAFHGQTSTVATVRVSNARARCTLGEAVTLTTLDVVGGQANLHCAATTVTVASGTLSTHEQGTIGTLNLNGGEASLNSSGTITTLNQNGGRADFSSSGVARTVSTYNRNEGTMVKGEGLTITTLVEPDGITVSTLPLAG